MPWYPIFDDVDIYKLCPLCGSLPEESLSPPINTDHGIRCWENGCGLQEVYYVCGGVTHAHIHTRICGDYDEEREFTNVSTRSCSVFLQKLGLNCRYIALNVISEHYYLGCPITLEDAVSVICGRDFWKVLEDNKTYVDSGQKALLVRAAIEELKESREIADEVVDQVTSLLVAGRPPFLESKCEPW